MKGSLFIMLTKICNKCGRVFPLTSEYFNTNKRHKDGFLNDCKICRHQYYMNNKSKISIMCKERYKNNKESIIEYEKQYAKANKEKIAEYKRQYTKENKEKIAEYKRQYYERNIEIVREKTKLYRKENKEKIKKYRNENKEHSSKYMKRWCNQNKDKRIINQQRRESKKKSLPNTLTSKQWDEIKAKFNNRCAYCGQQLPLEQEHFIPLSKGGEYTINNIMPSCKSCNSSKNNSDFFEWYPKQEYYSKKREKAILEFLGYNKDKQQLKFM